MSAWTSMLHAKITVLIFAAVAVALAAGHDAVAPDRPDDTVVAALATDGFCPVNSVTTHQKHVRVNGRWHFYLSRNPRPSTCESIEYLEHPRSHSANFSITPTAFDDSQAAFLQQEREPRHAPPLLMPAAAEAARLFIQNGALPFSLGHDDVHRGRLRAMARAVLDQPPTSIGPEHRFIYNIPWWELPIETRRFLVPAEARQALRTYFQSEPLLISAIAFANDNTTVGRQVQRAHADNSMPGRSFVNQLCSFSAAGVVGTWFIPGSHVTDIAWLSPTLFKRVTRTHNCIFLDGSAVHFGGATKGPHLDFKLILMWTSAAVHASRDDWTNLLSEQFSSHPADPLAPDPLLFEPASEAAWPSEVASLRFSEQILDAQTHRT